MSHGQTTVKYGPTKRYIVCATSALYNIGGSP